MILNDLPVNIMSFNRPDYLRQTLESIVSQNGFSPDRANVALFQDGAIAEDGEAVADLSDISESISIFRSFFPKGAVFASDKNIGVALNFERSERYSYVECEASAAFYFEDDMILGKSYFTVMDRICRLALEREDVGYFAAYGDHRKISQAQKDARNKLMPLEHNWAFGLTKNQWERSKPFVDQYLDIVRQRPYRQRDAQAVSTLTHSWGVKCPGSSQDVIKSLACYLTGGVKLNTVTCYAKYIGEHGLHMNPEDFQNLGFAKAVYFDEDICTINNITNVAVLQARSYAKRYSEIVAIPLPTVPTLTEVPTIENLSASDEHSANTEIEIFSPRMTELEVKMFSDYVRGVSNYMEFGATGSALLAHSLGAKKITVIDSNLSLLERLKSKIEQNENIIISHADIGPTKEWGVPVDQKDAYRWSSYYLDVWKSMRDKPDVIVIGGRFRVACALQAIARCGPNCIILFTDFWQRDNYYAVLKYCKIIDRIDQLAILKPLNYIDGSAIAVDVAEFSLDWG